MPRSSARPTGDWEHKVNVLERRRSISALMYLGRNGISKEIDIRDAVFPNPQQTAAQLSALRDAGLVDFERGEVPGTHRTAKYWSLTMRGEAVVAMLEVMEMCADGRLSPVRVIQACEALMDEWDLGPGYRVLDAERVARPDRRRSRSSGLARTRFTVLEAHGISVFGP